MIVMSLFSLFIFSGYMQATPIIQAQVPTLTAVPSTRTATHTPLPKITDTPTQEPPKFTATPVPPLLFQPIPKQKIILDESFIAMDVYEFLPDLEYPADEMNWTISGSKQISANISGKW